MAAHETVNAGADTTHADPDGAGTVKTDEDAHASMLRASFAPDGWPEDTTDLPFEIPFPECIANLTGLRRPEIVKACATSFEVRRRCVFCERPAVNPHDCLACGSARYCSRACCLEDSQAHSLICEQFREPETHKPPTTDHVRGFVFPARDKRPVAVWLRVTKTAAGAQSLAVHHPEFWSLATQFRPDLFPGFRIGCLNISAPLRGDRLNHGLFMLEWQLDPADIRQKDISRKWANRSIATLGKPGHMWIWTGPILIFSIDPDRSVVPTRAPHLPIHLSLQTLDARGFRQAVDYFQLNHRNPIFTDPHKRLTPLKDYVVAIRVVDLVSPLVRDMGVQTHLDEVKVPRVLPTTLPIPPPVVTPKTKKREPKYYRQQGLSCMAHSLGLHWIFRDAPAHAPELDWIYHPDVSLWTEYWRAIYLELPENHPQSLPKILSPGQHPPVAKLVPAGDAIMVLHSTGCCLCSHHVDALLAYIPLKYPDGKTKRDPALLERWEEENGIVDKIKAGKEGFLRFWQVFKARERVPDYVCDPYEAEDRFYRGAGGRGVGGVKFGRSALGWFFERERMIQRERERLKEKEKEREREKEKEREKEGGGGD